MKAPASRLKPPRREDDIALPEAQSAAPVATLDEETEAQAEREGGVGNAAMMRAGRGARHETGESMDEATDFGGFGNAATARIGRRGTEFGREREFAAPMETEEREGAETPAARFRRESSEETKHTGPERTEPTPPSRVRGVEGVTATLEQRAAAETESVEGASEEGAPEAGAAEEKAGPEVPTEQKKEEGAPEEGAQAGAPESEGEAAVEGAKEGEEEEQAEGEADAEAGAKAAAEEEAAPATAGEAAGGEPAAGGGAGAPVAGGGGGPEPEAADPEAEAEALEAQMAAAAPEKDQELDEAAEEMPEAAAPEDAALGGPAEESAPAFESEEEPESALPEVDESIPEPPVEAAGSESGESESLDQSSGTNPESAAPETPSLDSASGVGNAVPSARDMQAIGISPSALPEGALEEANEPEPVGPDDLEVGEEEMEAAESEPAGSGEEASAELSPEEQAVAMQSLEEEKGPEPPASGGGGASAGVGGGSGAAAEAPDVSGMEPEAAMGAVSGLPAVALAGALGGVSGAVSTSVGKKKEEFAANPPQMERPSGAPQTKSSEGGAQDDAAKGKDAAPVDKAAEGEEKPTPEPDPLPAPPPSPAEAVRQPTITGSPEGDMTEEDAQRLAGSIQSMPTSDPGLHATAGEPPTVVLEGNADPAQADDQKAELDTTITEAETEGRTDAAQYMGEDEIFPVVPPETLKANVDAGGGGGGGAPGGAGAAAGDAETLSIVAKEEKGGEIQGAIAQAQGDMASKRSEHEQKVNEEKEKNAEAIAELETENSEQQAEARAKAKEEVEGHRQEWTAGQDELVTTAQSDSEEALTECRDTVSREQESADKKSAKEIDKGNEEATTAREKGEKDAAAEKAKAKKKSSGFFGWLASKAKAFFNAIKAGIKKAFELARKAVKAAIELAKKAAAAVIELARKAIVAAIKLAGAALIAIGDVVLAGFPELRDKWRAAVKKTVDAAEKLVNELAEALKEGINKLLDLLGQAINGLLSLYEKALLAVVDAAAAVVEGAIKFAKSVVDALAAFAALIKDVASDPGGWIGNLGSAVVDGIKNDLWREFKAAVQEWFNSKIQGVLSLGAAIWGLLKSGGLGIAKIGKMAWDAVKAMIPPTLIRILIEKLVAMVVPAAGAVMAIIEGLQAAWGTVSRIIQAFGLFMDFLKAVKGGGAGPKFARALAAAAIVVIDFVANWLLLKIGKGLKKLGGKLKGIAKRLGKKRKGRKARAKKKKKAKDKAKKKKRARTGRRKPKRHRRAKKGSKSKKGKSKQKKNKKDKKRDKKKEKKRKRLEKAKRELPPKVQRLLAKKPNRIRLKATLALWKLKYRLTSLTVKGKETVAIDAVVNPRIKLGKGWSFTDAHLMRLVKEVAKEFVAVRPERTGPAATDVEPEEGLQTTDLTGQTRLPGALDEPGKLEIGGETQPRHRATAGSLEYGGSRAIVEEGKGGGLSYPQLADRLEGADAGSYMESLFTGKSTDSADLSGKQKSAADMAFALSMFEGTHPKGSGKHGRDFPYLAMMTQLATSSDPAHRITVSEGLREMPAGFSGAQAGTKTVTNKLDDPSFKEFKARKLGKSARERRRREAKLLEKWGKMQLPKWQKVYPKKPGDEEMKGLIRSSLMPLLERFRQSEENG